MNKTDTILICPLNWGLGHVSRDIPIIRRLITQKFRVIVAGDQTIIDYISYEIPDIETELLPDVNISYSKGNSQIIKLLYQFPKSIYSFYREKKLTAQLVIKYNPILIISDNRYGVRHPNVKSVIITHQLMLKMPKYLKWLEKITNRLIKKLVSKFDVCWIPDNPLPYSLAGDLVHKYSLPKNAILIGPISRFMDDFTLNNSQKDNFHSNNKYDLLAIISGPEPQRTILQQKLSQKLSTQNIKCLIVAGTITENSEIKQSKNIAILPHLDSYILANYIINTPIVVSRAGYSTIMDLWYLKRRAILIPTPGQTEQEYLAKNSLKQNHFFLKQSEILDFDFTQHTVKETDNKFQFDEKLLDKNLANILITLQH